MGFECLRSNQLTGFLQDLTRGDHTRDLTLVGQCQRAPSLARHCSQADVPGYAVLSPFQLGKGPLQYSLWIKNSNASISFLRSSLLMRKDLSRRNLFFRDLTSKTSSSE